MNDEIATTEQTVNAYVAARREWNERYGGYIVHAERWRSAALLSSICTMLAVGGVVYMATHSRYIPYVIQVDAQQNIVGVSYGEKLEKSQKEAVIRSLLTRFIEDVRSVVADGAAQKKAIHRAWTLLSRGDAATGLLEELLDKKNSPFERALTETVTVQVSSVLKNTEHTWDVEWIEILRNRNGTEKSREYWKGVLTVYTTEPQETTLQYNPIGLFVKEINWSRKI